MYSAIGFLNVLSGSRSANSDLHLIILALFLDLNIPRSRRSLSYFNFSALASAESSSSVSFLEAGPVHSIGHPSSVRPVSSTNALSGYFLFLFYFCVSIARLIRAIPSCISRQSVYRPLTLVSRYSNLRLCSCMVFAIRYSLSMVLRCHADERSGYSWDMSKLLPLLAAVLLKPIARRSDLEQVIDFGSARARLSLLF